MIERGILRRFRTVEKGGDVGRHRSSYVRLGGEQSDLHEGRGNLQWQVGQDTTKRSSWRNLTGGQFQASRSSWMMFAKPVYIGEPRLRFVTSFNGRILSTSFFSKICPQIRLPPYAQTVADGRTVYLSTCCYWSSQGVLPLPPPAVFPSHHGRGSYLGHAKNQCSPKQCFHIQFGPGFDILVPHPKLERQSRPQHPDPHHGSQTAPPNHGLVRIARHLSQFHTPAVAYLFPS